MSKLEELIEQYCPDGVEWKALYSITKQFSGMTGVSNKWAEEGNCVFIDYNNVYNHTSVDTTALKIATVKSLKQNTLKKGDILFTSASETPDECALSSVIEKDLPDGVFLDDHLFGLRLLDEYSSVISPSYLKYAFRSEQFRVQIKKVVRGATRHYVSKVDFMKLEIPVPPLPVQEEIVRILDTFTELQAELQAELQKRKQQYNYYRDNLLTNFTTEQNVKEYTLGELGTFTRGNGLQKKDFTKEGIGCIHYGQIYTRFGAFADKTLTYVNRELASHLLQVEKGNLVIACTSENVEDICKSVAWLGEENICTGGHACVFRHNQNPKYISYFFQTEYFFNQKKKYTYGTKVKDIKPDSIAKIKIPLPSLKEQERIVSILDNLYTLTTDLTQGLPAEIEKRRQQYEYYRDKLLTFKRKGA